MSGFKTIFCPMMRQLGWKPRLLGHIMFGWVIVSRQLHFDIYNLFVGGIKHYYWLVKCNLSHTYITSRPFPFGVGRDHFLPLATILTHTFKVITLYYNIFKIIIIIDTRTTHALSLAG
jgi:hypothetical protein